MGIQLKAMMNCSQNTILSPTTSSNRMVNLRIGKNKVMQNAVNAQIEFSFLGFFLLERHKEIGRETDIFVISRN
jgi:hypothetical protein